MKRLLLMTPLLFACPAEQKGPLTAPPAKAPPTAASQPATGAAASKPANPHDSFDKGEPGKPISGLIKLGENVKEEDVKPTDVLFIMARESQGGGKFGRLVAVQRHGKVEYPKRYELSETDVMVPGIPFKGPFIVMARLDRDGDPMTKKPDDLYAAFTGEVHSGQEGVHLTLRKAKVQENEAPKPPPGKAAPKGPASGPAKMLKAPASRPALKKKPTMGGAKLRKAPAGKPASQPK